MVVAYDNQLEAEPSPARRTPGPQPTKFTTERRAAYLSWLEKTGSHQLAATSQQVRLDPDFVLSEIRKDPELGRLAQIARRNYSHRLLTAIEQRVAAGEQL